MFVSFDILPEELVLKIFSFLTLSELCKTVALVCRLWLYYSRCPALRQRLSLSELTKSVCFREELSEFIRTNFPFLKYLYLQHRTELPQMTCRALARACPYLQSLSLSSCGTLTKEGINEFVTFCPQLREIDFEACVMTDECLEVLGELPLQKLNARYCTHLTDHGLTFLAIHCRQLTSLNFDGIQWISHEAIAILIENCMGRLEHLWLDGEDMTDVTVELISKCHHLKSFGLSFCDSLSDQSLKYMQKMTNLVTLRLKKGTEFSSQALKELFKHLHPQRTGNARGLLHVNIAECSKLDDAAVAALADSCRYLESIDISWCWEVTDAGLEHVINKCHRVVDMNICGAKDLRGNPLKEIPKHMPSLRSLNATQCNLVSDDLLEELAFLMPEMIVTNYYGEEVDSSKFKARSGPLLKPKNSWL